METFLDGSGGKEVGLLKKYIDHTSRSYVSEVLFRLTTYISFRNCNNLPRHKNLYIINNQIQVGRQGENVINYQGIKIITL